MAAPKVKVTFDNQKAANDLLKKFNKVKTGKAMNKEICVFLVKRTSAEARRRRPLNNQRKFKELKQLTKESRKRLAQFNKTHPSFSPNRSNLTFSGQLIDAIICRFNGKANILEIDNTARKPYKTGPNSSQKKVPNNAQVYSHLLDISKGFTLFSKKGIESDKQIVKRIKGILLKYLRRSLKVSSK